MKSIPVVSVITVVHNDANSLEKTINSVVEQIYDNIEYIIIDGGSTDQTIKIIKEYANDIDYWQSELDNGIYDAMNKGIRASSGDYILFLNAGDCFADRAVLKHIAEDIIKYKWPDMLYGETNVLSENEAFIKELKPLYFSRLNLTLFGTRTVCHQSVLIRKSIIPLYSADYKLKGDLAWYYDIVNISPRPRLVKLHYPISNYLLGGVSDISFKKNIYERLRVVADKQGILVCILMSPFLLIPVIFRLKRILHTKN